MSKKTNNEINNIIQSVLQDYALTCGVTPFNGKVIITEDMAKSYLDLRSDLVQNGMSDITDIQRYHGLTVQPMVADGTFTILLNKDYIVESMNKQNVDWLGTLVHEAVHVNDFKDYFRIISPDSYDELYDYNQHRIFQYWTEFHARAIGHYFLRKYTLDNFKDAVHIENLLNVELPYQINYMVTEVAATDNADRQMYVVVHFLGRLATWQHLYPETFNARFIKILTNRNPWLEELYYSLTKYDTLEDAYLHFTDIKGILDKHFS